MIQILVAIYFKHGVVDKAQKDEQKQNDRY